MDGLFDVNGSLSLGLRNHPRFISDLVKFNVRGQNLMINKKHHCLALVGEFYRMTVYLNTKCNRLRLDREWPKLTSDPGTRKCSPCGSPPGSCFCLLVHALLQRYPGA